MIISSGYLTVACTAKLSIGVRVFYRDLNFIKSNFDLSYIKMFRVRKTSHSLGTLSGFGDFFLMGLKKNFVLKSRFSPHYVYTINNHYNCELSGDQYHQYDT